MDQNERNDLLTQLRHLLQTLTLSEARETFADARDWSLQPAADAERNIAKIALLDALVRLPGPRRMRFAGATEAIRDLVRRIDSGDLPATQVTDALEAEMQRTAPPKAKPKKPKATQAAEADEKRERRMAAMSNVCPIPTPADPEGATEAAEPADERRAARMRAAAVVVPVPGGKPASKS